MADSSDGTVTEQNNTSGKPVTLRPKSFLDLPAELRNQIYDNIIYDAYGGPPARRHHAATVLCRQVRNEYLARYYQTVMPIVSLSPWGLGNSRIFNFEGQEWTRRTARPRSWIGRSYHFHYWQCVFGETRAPYLRRILVDSPTIVATIDLDKEEPIIVEVQAYTHPFTRIKRYRNALSSETIQELVGQEKSTIQAEVEGLLSLGSSGWSDGSKYITQRVLANIVRCLIKHDKRLHYLLRKMMQADPA